MKRLFWIIVVLLIFGVAFYWYHNRGCSAPDNKGHVGAAYLYPDVNFTPGNVLSHVTANDVCRHGYTKEVRSVSTALKREVCRRYGVSYPTPHGAYEIDHFIPLELGGSNDVTNLWPEPANPRPGFHEKDVVENYLHREVCKGRMTLKQAQEAIRNDWYAVYLSIPRKK